MSVVGVVVIGRNEGPRLARCLDSLRNNGMPIVYADSGSTDGSCHLASSKGATVVMLDESEPFTAARGRNAGLATLLQLSSVLKYVQFVDGDCEVEAGWIEHALNTLDSSERIAAVRGALCEKRRENSVYGRLLDMEWQRHAGEVRSCGGIAMIRVSAFQEVGGFDATVAAGEEAEFCRRLIKAGHRIYMLDHLMAAHDGGMTRFGQWWTRAMRSGRSYAQGAAMERGSAGRYNLRSVFSILFWGLLVPLIILALAWPTLGLSGLMLCAYGIMWFRVQRGRIRFGNSGRDAGLYATFCVLAKFAQLCGVIQLGWRQLWRRNSVRKRGVETEGAPAALVTANAVTPSVNNSVTTQRS